MKRTLKLLLAVTAISLTKTASAIPDISFQDAITGIHVEVNAGAAVVTRPPGPSATIYRDTPAPIVYNSPDPFGGNLTKQFSVSASVTAPADPATHTSSQENVSLAWTETGNTVRLNGSAVGTSIFGTNRPRDWSGGAGASMQLDFLFEVMAPVKYEFTGLLGIAPSESGTGGISGLMLIGPTTTAFQRQIQLVNGQTISTPLSFSGLLGPGLWRFSIYTQLNLLGTASADFDLRMQSTSPIPEPRSAVLLLAGLLLMGIVARGRLRR